MLEDDKVAEVYLERPERRSIAGNIYLGQVDNVLPGMEAAFVEIGLEKNGFLYVDEIVGPEIERGHGRKIQDLISKGQTILVQAVKDPMKTKGARLTTQISLPGRFVVFVPQGEGLGVSRRLDDEERSRLKDILKKLSVKEGGLIVRTAAEGASEDDIERDIVFLQRVWKSIEAKAKEASAPELIYQEAELPLRVTRDLFTGDFEKAYVDNDQAFKRITGYLKKTSPHMVERVVRYREKAPLMEHFGVEQEIKSTLSRRVDLPSGGYLIFDYAEAFTVIDVNTGRFVGSRGKNSGGRLEDTITKNNLEAVKEVVRQLRLRDIGGIIVIDFIDMANPKNRATVEEALRTELERDRTKTYVVEISPLGLVEMTRQNVTDGPREIMTRKCPTCGGDGIVYSEASAAIDVERRLRSLVAGSRSQAYRVELAAPIAAALIGPGAIRLQELEAMTKRRFFLAGEARHASRPLRRARRGQARRPRSGGAGCGRRRAARRARRGRQARRLGRGRQGRRIRRLRRRRRRASSARRSRCGSSGCSTAPRTRRSWRSRGKKPVEPLTAEGEAEKPTRKPPARKDAGAADRRRAGRRRAGRRRGAARRRGGGARGRGRRRGADAEDEAADAGRRATGAAAAKKKTRRGSRGGKNRKKTASTSTPAARRRPTSPEASRRRGAKPAAAVRIHVPGDDLGRDERRAEAAAPAAGEAGEPTAEPEAEAPSENGAAPAKKKTRRGSRGGKNRRKRTAAAGATNGAEPAARDRAGRRGRGASRRPSRSRRLRRRARAGARAGAEPEPVQARRPGREAAADDADEDWGYVPMSEWGDDLR